MAETFADRVASKFEAGAAPAADPAMEGPSSELGQTLIDAVTAGDAAAVEAAVSAICERMKSAY